MLTLQLNDEEHRAVLELLERELPELRREIHHTDDHDYREFLKAREHVLERLLDRVKLATSATASGSDEAEKSGHAI
jgi:hypothetical protein